MRRFMAGLKLACGLVLIALTAGCGDNPGNRITASDSPGYTYMTPADPGECDPYYEADWSCEEPPGGGGVCMESSVPGGWDMSAETCSGGDDGDGESGGGSSGGTTSPPPPSPYGCDARDPTCPVPLNSQDTVLILNAIAVFAPEAAPICDTLVKVFNRLWSEGKVFRGAWDSKDHHAQTYKGIVHIDPKLLDRAHSVGDSGGWEYVTAATLLHEAAHAAGVYPNHGPGEPPFTTYPYNHMDPTSGAVQCVRS